MHIHEYQAKTLFQQRGIPVPPFGVASNQQEALNVIEEMGLTKGVVKAQVHAGGRGKAGGVKIADDIDAILFYTKEMLGKNLITPQTGPAGAFVGKVLISELLTIKKESYLAITYDRKRACPVLIAALEGGVEIEEKEEEKLLKLPLPNDGSIRSYHLLEIAKFLEWDGALRWQGVEILKRLTRLFYELDATLIEINPLVESDDAHLYALDAKISIDDNALFRHPDLASYYDASQGTPLEALAKQEDLSYIGLDGNIGCVVNGAGLAMASMDIIKTFGGNPANFLDVGGGASFEKISFGFKILLQDLKVKVIFVNIFGGIMDCGLLAAGFIEAAKKDQVKVPLVFRLEGTNEEKGKNILKDSGLTLEMADTMDEGAKKAIELLRKC